MKNNIVLVGFMGTGKTRIARDIARGSGMEYVSTDDLIETREGRSIKDIFSDEGEAYFRRVEKEVVAEVMSRSGQVVDTGGGVVLDGENMKTLLGNGTVICLWATPDVIYARTRAHGHRPLLNVDDPVGRIKELLSSRKAFYEKAEIHIDTSAKDPDRVAQEARRKLSDKGVYPV